MPTVGASSETRTIAGNAPSQVNAMVTADQETIFGNGTTADPLRTAGGGTGAQRFVYTAIGDEGDDFTIDLPDARANTNYVAQVSGGGLAFQLTFDVILADNALDSIHVASSGSLTAGDKLVVVVADLA